MKNLAIETAYKGYRFRSRLEARWAVFFDTLDVRWEYEKEGYRLPSGNYLPDFWLPKIKTWVETKGKLPSKREQKLASELAEGTKSRVILIHGPVPGWDIDGDTGQNFHHTNRVDMYGKLPPWDNFYGFCVCEECGLVGIEYQGRSDRLKCKKGKKPCKKSSHGDKGQTYDHSRILQAVFASRAARFEYGENG